MARPKNAKANLQRAVLVGAQVRKETRHMFAVLGVWDSLEAHVGFYGTGELLYSSKEANATYRNAVN